MGSIQVVAVGNGVRFASEVRDGVIFPSETVRDGVIFASDSMEFCRIGLGKQGMAELHDDCPRPLHANSTGKVIQSSAME
jgi:hypothetical protein